MGIARRDAHGTALARSGQPLRYWPLKVSAATAFFQQLCKGIPER
jgi:hypothetical protein